MVQLYTSKDNVASMQNNDGGDERSGMRLGLLISQPQVGLFLPAPDDGDDSRGVWGLMECWLLGENRNTC